MLNLKKLISLCAVTGLALAGLTPAHATSDPIVAVEINQAGSSTPRFLTTLGDYVYFTANNGTDGVEIWFTDGTANGTQMVGDINPAGNALTNTFDPYFALVGDFVYYRATDGTNGLELYRSPLGQTGFTRITNINSAGNSLHGWVGGFPSTPQANYNQGPLVPHFGNAVLGLNGKVFFIADDGTGTDVFVYDPATTPNGSSAGVTQLTGGAGSTYELTVWGGEIHYVFDPSNGGVNQIYRLDSNLAPQLVVSAAVTGGHNGGIYRLMPSQSKLVYLETTDNPEARIRVIDRDSNPMVPVTVTTTEPIKTDIGMFPKHTLIGNELYFVTTSNVVGRTPAYRTELRHINLAPAVPVATTVTTQFAQLSSNNVIDRTFTPVVAIGSDRYVIKLDGIFDFNLYQLTGATLGSQISDSGSLYSPMAAIQGKLAYSVQLQTREDLALLTPGGASVEANRGGSTAAFSVKEVAAFGTKLVVSAQSPDSNNWDLFLLNVPAPVAQSNPAPYEGPVVTTITGTVEPGQTVTVSGDNLDSVTQAEIDSKNAPISEQSSSSLKITIPQDLTPGVKDLKLTSSFGVLTAQGFLTIEDKRSQSLSLGEWTKLQPSGMQVKFYSKNPVAKGKVQFFVDGNEVAWIRATSTQDRKLSKASGSDYFVRTINLKPGKNRVEIRIDGQRVWRATYVPRG